MNHKLILLLLIPVLFSCSSSKTFVKTTDGDPSELIAPPENEKLYEIFLIGDAGSPTLDQQEPNLKLFQQFVEKAGERSTAVFLGDNIYLYGLPDSLHPQRDFYEARIVEQLKTVSNYEGRVVFIPGNHDWDDGRRGGLEAVKRQEQFVEAYLDKGNTFLPDNGFPGPVSVKLMDDDEHPALREDIRLIVLDTQWWLHEHEKSYGDNGEFEVSSAGDVLTELDDILKKQRNDFLLVAAHHPLITQGPHGGYLHPSRHLKPPVFGSLYALYRRVFGFEQDVPHYKYNEMSRTLRDLFSSIELEHLAYASGHSHSLQHHIDGPNRYERHYLVSGAGTKENYVAKGRGAEFTHEGKGFMVLKYYEDGSVWVEGWVPEGDGSTGERVYRNRIKEPYDDPLPDTEIESLPDIDYSDSTMTIAANPDYDNKSGLVRSVLGSHNRAYWSVEETFPVFDITEVEGGLTPVRIGGKGQSTTLHMEREDGADFVLRSVDKEAGRIWSEELRNTVAFDLAQDQFSILNPYAALVIPKLASAAGVFHTNPKLYYVPDDPRLGRYADLLAGELALFEERPNGDMSDVSSVGYSEEVLSHAELIRELDGDIDHRVDQYAFARARLLDLLLADWDRHRDQWRWASFEPEDEQGKIYIPVPRDRDYALMNMTGLIPSLAKLGPFFQYQNFDSEYGSLRGLNFNSLPITRRFTNQLSREDWVKIAEEMEQNLTDEVIQQAVQEYPPKVYEEFGAETIDILKARRDQLRNVAERTYRRMSEVVSIQGSNKRERFVIQITAPDRLEVEVYKLGGDGDLRDRYYYREFRYPETKELRLAGMNADDEFVISGDAQNPTEILIIGGSGKDKIQDSSVREGRRPNITIYDTSEGNNIDAGPNTRLKTSDDPYINAYNYRNDYKWDRRFYGFFMNYNTDDGLFIGGGPTFVNYDFRNHPSQRHSVKANYAPKTGAANVKYEGSWYRWRKNLDVQLKTDFYFPKSYKNFFGLGNGTTEEDRQTNYYRARLSRISIDPRLVYSKNEVFNVYGGIFTTFTRVDGNDDNILNDPELNIPQETFSTQWYTGIKTGVEILDLDDRINPKQGYRFMAGLKGSVGLQNTPGDFATVDSELRIYLSPSINPQITIANRTGAAHNVGAFPFYEANTLGGTTNLRGFRSDRFSGRSSVYNNLELRMELFDFYRYLLGGKVGFNAFYDTGRVWSASDESQTWHKGYGGGIWFHAFESFLFNTSLGVSGGNSLLIVTAGFLF